VTNIADSDVRQQLLEAQRLARTLKAVQTAEGRESIRNKIAQQFFGEEGIPSEISEGWEVLEEARRVRSEMGYPLPEGGCLVLGTSSVIAGCMAEMHMVLSGKLDLPANSIHLKLTKTEDGRLQPVADIELPEGWLLPRADPRRDPGEAVQEYLSQAVQEASRHFRVIVSERLRSCMTRRSEGIQAVEPWAASQEK